MGMGARLVTGIRVDAELHAFVVDGVDHVLERLPWEFLWVGNQFAFTPLAVRPTIVKVYIHITGILSNQTQHMESAITYSKAQRDHFVRGSNDDVRVIPIAVQSIPGVPSHGREPSQIPG